MLTRGLSMSKTHCRGLAVLAALYLASLRPLCVNVMATVLWMGTAAQCEPEGRSSAIQCCASAKCSAFFSLP